MRGGSLGASVALHTAALLGFFSLPRAPASSPPVTVSVEVRATSAPSPRPALGEVVTAVPGPADFVSPSPASPWPRADVDAPGARAAAAGGGAEGGADTWTGRHDDEAWRAQLWNDPHAYRIPRVRTAPDRATSDSIARRPDPRLGTQTRRAAPLARAGARGGPGDGDRPLGRAGDVRADAARPLVADGTPAVEADRHGAVRDDTTSAQASDERWPGLFEMTQPRAGGGEGEGVAGLRAGPGPSAESPRERGGEAGTTADLPTRPGGAPTTRARPEDAWLKLLFARVRDRVVFPRALAVSFDQGAVVVAFTLKNADGALEEVVVTTSSGYAEFDDAVVAAIRSAAPFGPVPRELANARGALRVSAPFSFENPIIR
jgi:TonB family protein